MQLKGLSHNDILDRKSKIYLYSKVRSKNAIETNMDYSFIYFYVCCSVVIIQLFIFYMSAVVPHDLLLPFYMDLF